MTLPHTGESVVAHPLITNLIAVSTQNVNGETVPV